MVTWSTEELRRNRSSFIREHPAASSTDAGLANLKNAKIKEIPNGYMVDRGTTQDR